MSAVDLDEIFGEHDRGIASDVVVALEKHGYRLIGPGGVDHITIDRAVNACHLQLSRGGLDGSLTEWDRGNNSGVDGCIAAVRSLGNEQ